MINDIFLSICIPTYNRAKYLEKTILSIVNQKRFKETNEVEIVIADNCSEDNTREIAENFQELYHEKIRYYRNSENIVDLNFEKVLSYGKGLFLKLNNDTLMHYDDTLDKLIETINQNTKKKDILFFSNGTCKHIVKTHCKDLNSFVKTVSYYSTWIACFGIWKKDFDSLEGFSKNYSLQLVQTDVLLRLISLNKAVEIDNTQLFNSISPATKGGYNIYKIFVTNYLGLLEEYRRKNQLSWITLFNEKTKLLIFFLVPWSIRMWKDKTQYSFDKKGVVNMLLDKYRYHPALYFGAIYFSLKIFSNVLGKLSKK